MGRPNLRKTSRHIQNLFTGICAIRKPAGIDAGKHEITGRRQRTALVEPGPSPCHFSLLCDGIPGDQDVRAAFHIRADRWNRRPGAEPDACEIGYSWLTRSAIRTAANTEAKLLMLTRAFETWRIVRVCLHTDA
jgi:hypothetical protein